VKVNCAYGTGSEETLTTASRGSTSLPPPFILSVGGRHGYLYITTFFNIWGVQIQLSMAAFWVLKK
jgi:hypothetical protein